jgi:spore germination cell wall hydrolase CwlJ-like protein
MLLRGAEQNGNCRVLAHIHRKLTADDAIHLVGVELGLVVVLGASLAVAAAPAPSGARLAALTDGDVSAKGFERLTGRMDPAMLALATRFDAKGGTTRWTMTPPAGASGQTDALGVETVSTGAAEAAPVIRLQDLSPDAARVWNANNPVTTGANAAAKPFHLATTGVLDEARAVDCMTAAVYYEAAVESTDGQRAVAQVVLNRMRHPAFPKTVCGVVFQGSNLKTGCQFSFTCDGSLGRTPSEAGWTRARQVAVAALNGYVMKKVGNATHYHANYVAPYWSPSLLKVGAIGAHIFYRWTGSWGLPPAFSGRYGGGEMTGLRIAMLDNLAKNPGKIEAQPVSDATAPQVPAVEVAAAPKEGEPGGLADAEVITATSAAKDAGALLNPQELDWAGRPKPKTSRVAMPRAGF